MDKMKWLQSPDNILDQDSLISDRHGCPGLGNCGAQYNGCFTLISDTCPTRCDTYDPKVCVVRSCGSKNCADYSCIIYFG